MTRAWNTRKNENERDRREKRGEIRYDESVNDVDDMIVW